MKYSYFTAKMVAGDRFELPMLLAYETGVVTTLPAELFIYCETHWITTILLGLTPAMSLNVF